MIPVSVPLQPGCSVRGVHTSGVPGRTRSILGVLLLGIAIPF